jgi:hypothetical protein
MIQPSTGRIVLYRPNGAADPEPHAAIVIAVHDHRLVNLACFSPEGTYYHRLNVHLLQDDDAAPAEGGYAEWMAFQKGQAPGSDAVKEQLAKIEAQLAAHVLLAPRLEAGEKLLETGGIEEPTKMAALDPRLAQIEGLLTADGPIHEMFKELQGRLDLIEAHLAAAPAPNAPPPIAPAPQAKPISEGAAAGETDPARLAAAAQPQEATHG